MCTIDVYAFNIKSSLYIYCAEYLAQIMFMLFVHEKAYRELCLSIDK